jgi:hypothetical protein
MSTDYIALATEALTAEGPDAYLGANVDQLATFLAGNTHLWTCDEDGWTLSRSSTPPCAHRQAAEAARDAAEPD